MALMKNKGVVIRWAEQKEEMQMRSVIKIKNEAHALVKNLLNFQRPRRKERTSRLLINEAGPNKFIYSQR